MGEVPSGRRQRRAACLTTRTLLRKVTERLFRRKLGVPASTNLSSDGPDREALLASYVGHAHGMGVSSVRDEEDDDSSIIMRSDFGRTQNWRGSRRSIAAGNPKRAARPTCPLEHAWLTSRRTTGSGTWAEGLSPVSKDPATG